jgi:hypothetical protein
VSYSHYDRTRYRMRDRQAHLKEDNVMSVCNICGKPIVNVDATTVNDAGDLVHSYCDGDMIDDVYDDCD